MCDGLPYIRANNALGSTARAISELLSALQTEPSKFGHVPLFHAAWLFAGGIALTYWTWLRPGVVLVGMGLVVVLCAIAAWRAQRIAWLPVAALWCLLGVWCAEMEPHPAVAPELAGLSDGLMRAVEGTVVDAGALRSEAELNLDEPVGSGAVGRPSQRVDLRIANVELVTDELDEHRPATGGVRLTVRWPVEAGVDAQPLKCGDRVRALARLRQPETYHDPGVWSREEFLVDQGITSTATVDFDRVERLGSSNDAGLACRLSGWQHAATERLLALPAAMRGLPVGLRLSPEDAAMLAAMVAGDRTYLTHSLRVGFERTGSFHMLVVSGFHLAIVAGCILWVLQRMRLPRIPATLMTLAATFAYALFTGFATPVQRSLWMITLYLLARLVYRERNALNTIGFASLCLMVVSPRSLFDASLQMTLLAVVSIAGVAAPLLANTVHPYVVATRDLRTTAIDAKLPPRQAQFREVLRTFATAFQGTRFDRGARAAVPWLVRFVLRVYELVVVSCVVELAMTLPMAIYFHRITIFALPVNLFILPLLVLMMPAALVTLAISLVSPAAAAVPGMVVALLLHFGLWLVHFFGSLAMGDFRIPGPLMVQSLAFCALLAAAVLLARGPRWQRVAAWAAMGLAAFAAVAPRPIEHPRGAMLMEAIDVGQGDSLLLITPDGKTLLVDGGGFGGGPHQAPQDFDIGEEVVSEVLWARGIRHLDAVALTHAHSDHMGGLPAVLRNFHPDELWVGNNPRFGAYNALLNEAAELHVQVRSLRDGDGFQFGSAQIAVLAPFKDYQPGPEPTNNDSLVMHMAYGGTSVMLEGDAEGPVEQGMLAEQGLQSSLLKVGHHGSVTSTHPEFLSRVAPQWAVISCGLHNRYGHPRPEVLEELQTAGVRTYRTDIEGAVCFRLNGKSVTADATCGWERRP